MCDIKHRLSAELYLHLIMALSFSHIILSLRLQLSGIQQTTAALPVVGTDGTRLQAAHLFLTRERLSLCPIEPDASTRNSHLPKRKTKSIISQPFNYWSQRGDDCKWQPIRGSCVSTAPKGMTTFNPVWAEGGWFMLERGFRPVKLSHADFHRMKHERQWVTFH